MSEELSVFGNALHSPEVTSLLSQLEKGEVLSFTGIVETAKPFLMTLFASSSKRSLCVETTSVKQQEHLYSEISALLPFLSKQATVLFFPETEGDLKVEGGPLRDLETTSEILGTLRSLQKNDGIKIIVTTKKALDQKVPSPNSLDAETRFLRLGDQIEMEHLVKELVKLGYENEAQVAGRGQFARRGGILDVFPLQTETAVRIEFNGDIIESMRLFDLETQASIQPTDTVEVTGVGIARSESFLSDYLPKDHLVWREPTDSHQFIELGDTRKMNQESSSEKVALEIFGHDFLATSVLDPVIQAQRHELLMSHWKEWIDLGFNVVIFCNNEGEEHRFREWMSHETWAKKAIWLRSPLLRGFSWPDLKLIVLSDAEIFGRYQTLHVMRLQQKRARARARREALDFSQFEEGDLVVHMHHGIGRFVGIRKLDVHGREQEVLTVEYEEGALLHVPIEQAHLVGRYVGVGKAQPALDRLGGGRWEKAAAQAQRSVMDYAAELLKVQAQRQAHTGFAFAKDHDWQKEFEDAFLFDETADQLTAIIDTKEDMESTKPMDRLICGDVGFGKTEVAIRAAFKAVTSGKQVAVLVPTTVLAQQHEQTFRQRMADYPVRIDLLSRFRTKAQQRKTLDDAKKGAVDILIGTHRLLQPDVVFKDLGLIVVDEEQRFGVKHKERFKETFQLVDVLTLSATPIPRTLYLSLMGARDISTIETPPANRLPVETLIAEYDERLIRSAIERELARDGQVYFLHNRVQSIQKVRDRIVDLIPKARVEIGHGQMHEDELEEVMLRFVAGEIDVLVATTIIESGLDIPRANTIIIDRADRFGLADLYQLRGRVGRSQMKAYAYLLLPRHLMIEADARKRISAIKQYSQLGSGFKVAMRDLEIRGAGNVLGTEQSGHATAIGFELYCQLLKETLARLQGKKLPPRIEVHLRFDFLPMSEDMASENDGAYIPRLYMQESKQRIEAYKHLAEIRTDAELKKLVDQWRDRFGQLPKPVTWLIKLAQIRLLAASSGITSIEVEEGKVIIQKKGQSVMFSGKFPRLINFIGKKPSFCIEKWLGEILKLVKTVGDRKS